MERELTIAIWQDDHVDEAMERMKFVLSEMGVKVKISEVRDGCTVYSLSHAELLDDGKEEKS